MRFRRIKSKDNLLIFIGQLRWASQKYFAPKILWKGFDPCGVRPHPTRPHTLNPSPQQWGEGLLSPSPLLGRTPRGRVGMGFSQNNILCEILLTASHNGLLLLSYSIKNIFKSFAHHEFVR